MQGESGQGNPWPLLYSEQAARVEISKLSAVGSSRSAGTDPDHVLALAQVQDELPPIVVHRKTMRVVDGAHRLAAARRRGDVTIAVRFFDGSAADAFVVGVRANIAHGLPLTLADRKQAAGQIAQSHPHWSDRMVASVTGLAAGTVAEIRRRIPSPRTAANARFGQDGRVRPLDGTRGRLLACELITENPQLSLRQIAQQAGISPETARDVRNRLRRGEDPIPKERAGARPLSTSDAPAIRNSAVRTTTTTAVRAPGVRDAAAVVARLKADPALRYNETGRNLLGLLTIHTMGADEWDSIIDNVPPHCSDVVAGLARDCAERWQEFAVRLESRTRRHADPVTAGRAGERPAAPPHRLPRPPGG